jgi:UDP-N-acetylmuramoylalanine--D-glutamate ligase
VRFSDLDGLRIGVWGAGREIASLARQLAARAPRARIAVAVFDDPPAQEQVAGELRTPDVRVVAAAGAVEALSGCELVVRSPGVSVYRPELRELGAAGVPVTTATSLWLAEHGPEGVVGVSGTKGKSTTAALIAHLARAVGASVALAGNIGVPALDLLGSEPARITVLELSSYQIADLDSGPEVALLTNLFKEHTDWHGSEERYRADKLRLPALPGVRVAVLNARDPGLMAAFEPPVRQDGDVPPALHYYGTADGWDATPDGITYEGRLVAAPAQLPLPGEHNALNLCGALTALQAVGIEPPMPQALAGFRGLEHRLQRVAEHDGVTWVNDSISTTPESTLAALASFPGRELILIAGGQDRGQDYAALGEAIARSRASLIGVPSTGPRLLGAARAAGVPSERVREAAGLEEATAIARAQARAGTVVLLSPAAPSFDHYRDFEERGERFSALARESAPRR